MSTRQLMGVVILQILIILFAFGAGFLLGKGGDEPVPIIIEKAGGG